MVEQLALARSIRSSLVASFNKTQITRLVNNKLKGLIGVFHIYSVINIFLNEMCAELKAGRKVKIDEFGTFELTDIDSKKAVNILTGKIGETKPSKALRFRLAAKFKRQLGQRKQPNEND